MRFLASVILFDSTNIWHKKNNVCNISVKFLGTRLILIFKQSKSKEQASSNLKRF